MYGGVAQTYCKWQMSGEPYKKGETLYAKMIHPLTKNLKEVRFYTDKKHADLMPQTKTSSGTFHTVFGFTDENDTVLCIKEKDLSTDEVKDYFEDKWRAGQFFGKVWYAPKETVIPPIANLSKVFSSTWQEFRAAGQVISKRLKIVPESSSPWFQ